MTTKIQKRGNIMYKLKKVILINANDYNRAKSIDQIEHMYMEQIKK